MAEIKIDMSGLENELNDIVVGVIKNSIAKVKDAAQGPPLPTPPQYIEFARLSYTGNDKFNCRIIGPCIVLFTQCTNGYAPAIALPIQRHCGAYYYTKESFFIQNGVGARYTTLNGDIYTCCIISNEKITLSLVKE